VRLPINNNDLVLVTLPEAYQANEAIDVAFQSSLVGNQTWRGEVIRSEAAIDDTSQQLYVVAQINQPFTVNDQQPVPIKIGQYLTANIAGKTLDNAIVIPNNTIYQGSYVYVVRDDKLFRQSIDILWQNSDEALIEQGLNTGDQLVMTSLGQVSSGTKVAIVGDKSNSKPKRNQQLKLSSTQGSEQAKPERRQKPDGGGQRKRQQEANL